MTHSFRRSRRRFTRAATAALGVAAARLVPCAHGQTAAFPSRPIRIVVPFGPGSGTDTATRQLAQLLEGVLGQPVIVENRPGANGAIAAAAVAKAPADGYTLLMGTNSTHGANPGLIAKMTHDPLKDFVPIGMIALFSSLLVVHVAQRLNQMGAEPKWMARPSSRRSCAARSCGCRRSLPTSGCSRNESGGIDPFLAYCEVNA